MGLLGLLFRAARKSERRTRRTSTVVVTQKRAVYKSSQVESVPVSEPSKIKRIEDVDLIQALPSYKVEHIIDGDTVIVSSVSSQFTVRLDSIDCPENGQEWGDIATRGLIKLIGGQPVKIEDHGFDAHGRTLGTLFVYLQDKGEWQNVNERMVTLGHAWVMRLYYAHLPKPRQQKLNQLESWAKSKSVGLWKTNNPIPPWEWRRN